MADIQLWNTNVITIDGTSGEGGGQILRTSLALALITKSPLTIESIRGKRRKPGLMRQHLTCVQACELIGAAKVTGAVLGSQRLIFEPDEATAGDYEFRIGSAGSTSLVFQTVLPALLMANRTSTLRIEGGTHNPLAPSYEFLAKTFLPHLQEMGAQVDLRLERHGFNPAGGGALLATIEPWKDPAKLVLEERGPLKSAQLTVLLSGVERDVGKREIDAILSLLSMELETRIDVVNSDGPGNYVSVDLVYEHTTAHFSEYGTKGVRAETVAKRLVAQVKKFLSGGAPVGEHLADQLMLPAVLGHGAVFQTSPLSRHSTTQIESIQAFKPDASIQVEKGDDRSVQVSIQ